MIESAQGSLAMIGLNTATPQVFWNGQAIPGLVSIKTEWEDDEARVKLKVTGEGLSADLYNDLVTSGIVVKKEK